MRAWVLKRPSLGRVVAVALRGFLRVQYLDDVVLVGGPSDGVFAGRVEIQVVAR